MTENNQGIVVTGGSLTGGSIAVGQNAQAIQTVYNLASDLQAEGKPDIAQALKDLLQAIEIHGADLEDREELTQVVQQIAEELKKEKPSKITLKGLLGGVKDAVGTVVEIAEKVGALQGAIGLLLGVPLF
ncbi:hypothetical protein ACN4EG_24210 [Alkalinema pantanalense CENA528]|uniref:hypothetical protein n=1 Tax=Alkalinema pantanalense TaxID=1620705 RepID=UPI003D6EDC4B